MVYLPRVDLDDKGVYAQYHCYRAKVAESSGTCESPCRHLGDTALGMLT